MDEMCNCCKNTIRQPCLLATNKANVMLKVNTKCFYYDIALFLLFFFVPMVSGQNPTITSSSFNNAFGEGTNITFTCTSTTHMTWSRSPSITVPALLKRAQQTTSSVSCHTTPLQTIT